MAQILHGSATTTEAIGRAIQDSQESLRSLAKRYGINQKTVAKWKKRTSVADLPTGPSEPKSTVLSGDEEAIIIAFRRHPLLPLDDCLYSWPVDPERPPSSSSSGHPPIMRRDDTHFQSCCDRKVATVARQSSFSSTCGIWLECSKSTHLQPATRST